MEDLFIKIFGVKVSKKAVIYSSAKVYYPANLIMDDYACLASDVNCYNVDVIKIGMGATVSQGAYLCTAGHDIYSREHTLVTAPIIIESQAWVAADAFIGMGVSIGEGAVVGARAAVFKDVEPWTVVGGNPAKLIKKRVIKIKLADMLDISAIILTFNEEMHIKRCLDKISPLVKEIFIIDSYSTDRTLEISKEYENVTVLQNKWVNYATQFNWGLKNAPIKTEWVIRLDADEYLLPELVEELEQKMPHLEESITGITLKRRHIFLGKWMKRGTYPVKLLRIFKANKAICEERFMDEHIQLLEGTSVEMENDFVDHNLNNISWWANKHVGYSIREAVDLLDIEFNLTGSAVTDEGKNINEQAQSKRMKKHKYAKQPLFWRSFAYFCYRYFFKMAFLEGKEGFLWTFMQGWWYRTLVDAKIFEIKKACGNDPEKIKQYLKKEYNIEL